MAVTLTTTQSFILGTTMPLPCILPRAQEKIHKVQHDYAHHNYRARQRLEAQTVCRVPDLCTPEACARAPTQEAAYQGIKSSQVKSIQFKSNHITSQLFLRLLSQAPSQGKGIGKWKVHQPSELKKLHRTLCLRSIDERVIRGHRLDVFGVKDCSISVPSVEIQKKIARLFLTELVYHLPSNQAKSKIPSFLSKRQLIWAFSPSYWCWRCVDLNQNDLKYAESTSPLLSTFVVRGTFISTPSSIQHQRFRGNTNSPHPGQSNLINDSFTSTMGMTSMTSKQEKNVVSMTQSSVAVVLTRPFKSTIAVVVGVRHDAAPCACIFVEALSDSRGVYVRPPVALHQGQTVQHDTLFHALEAFRSRDVCARQACSLGVVLALMCIYTCSCMCVCVWMHENIYGVLVQFPGFVCDCVTDPPFSSLANLRLCVFFLTNPI